VYPIVNAEAIGINWGINIAVPYEAIPTERFAIAITADATIE
jgi:hypothetical protein